MKIQNMLAHYHGCLEKLIIPCGQSLTWGRFISLSGDYMPIKTVPDIVKYTKHHVYKWLREAYGYNIRSHIEYLPI